MNNKDNFFEEVANTKPYLKAAFEGFAGTGKTYTASLVAIGLWKRIKSDKPVVMFDTEEASKFLKSLFESNGIKLMVKRSRTLKDLVDTMDRCKQGYSDILLIDSISHVWEDTVEAFKKKYNRAALQFQDWGTLKPLWKGSFSDKLVRDPYHILMCGRAGYEYENEINEATGKREIYKSGVKMKVEGETAYEPDILVLMERFEEVLTKNKKVYRQATVIKDRSTLLDGKVFKNPTYKEFSPAVEALLENPSLSDVKETDSTGMFKTEEDKFAYKRAREIALEQIENELIKAWPSVGAEHKKAKINTLEKVFGSSSWTFVTERPLDVLESGLEAIKSIVTDELTKQYPDAQKVGAKATA